MWRRLQKPTNSGNVSSISTCSSTKRIRSACFARTSANCRAIDSRVPIFRARCSSSISHQLEGANSSRIASATSVRVIVPSKSVRTASLEGIEGSPSAPRASRAFAPRVEVRALLLREPIDLDAEAVEFEPSDLQVQVLRDGIHARLQLRRMLGQVAGADGLDREAHVHDLDGVALPGRDIQETALRDQVDPLAVREDVFLDELPGPPLRFREALEVGLRDFVVKMARVPEDHLVFQPRKMRRGHDVLASGRGDDER